MDEKEIVEVTDEVLDEVIDEVIDSEEDLLDLLEENPLSEDNEEEEERNESILNEFDQPGLQNLDDFDIDKYLSENYSFKEIEAVPFEEYKKQQLELHSVISIMKIYEQGRSLKGLDTFDDFLKFKKENNNIYIIKFGLPFEYELFGMEPKFFICKAFTSKDYIKMTQENPDAENDIDYYNDYIISNSVLYPEIRMEDVGKLEYGIADVLLPAILKHSRFNTNYKIERL